MVRQNHCLDFGLFVPSRPADRARLAETAAVQMPRGEGQIPAIMREILGKETGATRPGVVCDMGICSDIGDFVLGEEHESQRREGGSLTPLARSYQIAYRLYHIIVQL